MVLGSLLLAKKEQTVDTIVKTLDKVFDRSRHQEEPRGLTDVIQVFFRCCGLNDIEFYESDDLPTSCCSWEDQQKKCQKSTTGKEGKGRVNQRGCHSAYESWLSSQVKVVVIALFSVSLVELIAVIFSCYLSKST